MHILKVNGYRAIFESEGNVQINLPKSGFQNLLTKTGRNKVFKAFMFSQRHKSEPLLRKDCL